MSKGLIDKKLNNQINELIGQCFAVNRMLDRGMSLLNVRWKMVKTAQILHPKVAHAFPSAEFADGLSDYQAQRSNETVYPATPIGDREYDKPIDFFNDMLKELLSLQDMLYDTYEAANDISDYTTKAVISGIIKNLVKYTDIAQLLIDLAENFGSDTMGIALMDASIDKYIN